jgi:hypothetical protein
MANTSSLTSVSKILAAFPVQTIPPIVGEPTYESVTELVDALRTNASEIRSPHGDDDLGHLILTMTPAAYQAIAGGIAFVVPPNPGPFYVPAPGMTGPQMAQGERTHNSALGEYDLYHNTDKALKQQAISAIEPIYLRALKHRITKFSNVTTQQIIAHLYRTYANITANDLEENDKRFRAPFDPNQPFETIISQIDDATDFAIAGETPYTNEQIVSNAYNLVYNTGMFETACREWRRLPAADKTWTRFQQDFSQAHTDYRNQRHLSSKGAGFANQAFEQFCHEATDSLRQHLANATTSDKENLQTIIDANKTLSAQVTALTAAMKDMQSKIQLNQKQPPRDNRRAHA